MTLSSEMAHLPTVITPLAKVKSLLLAVLPPLLVVLELHLYLLPSQVALVISLDTLAGWGMIFHVNKSKTVFRIPVSLGDQAINSSVFFEEPSEFVFDVWEFTLTNFRGTFPSMLVMNNFPVRGLSSERDRSRRLSTLESLLFSINYIHKLMFKSLKCPH